LVINLSFHYIEKKKNKFRAKGRLFFFPEQEKDENIGNCNTGQEKVTQDLFRGAFFIVYQFVMLT
jgi:hypothetical protein